MSRKNRGKSRQSQIQSFQWCCQGFVLFYSLWPLTDFLQVAENLTISNLRLSLPLMGLRFQNEVFLLYQVHIWNPWTPRQEERMESVRMVGKQPQSPGMRWYGSWQAGRHKGCEKQQSVFEFKYLHETFIYMYLNIRQKYQNSCWSLTLKMWFPVTGVFLWPCNLKVLVITCSDSMDTFAQTSRDGERQGSLAWAVHGVAELDKTEQLNNH